MVVQETARAGTCHRSLLDILNHAGVHGLLESISCVLVECLSRLLLWAIFARAFTGLVGNSHLRLDVLDCLVGSWQENDLEGVSSDD